MKERRCTADGMRSSAESPSPSTGEGRGEGVWFANATVSCHVMRLSPQPLSPTPLPQWGEGPCTTLLEWLAGRHDNAEFAIANDFSNNGRGGYQ